MRLRVVALADVIRPEQRPRRNVRKTEGAGHEHQRHRLVGVVLQLQAAVVHPLHEVGGPGALHGGGDQPVDATGERQQVGADDADTGEVPLPLPRNLPLERGGPARVAEEDAVAVVHVLRDGIPTGH